MSFQSERTAHKEQINAVQVEFQEKVKERARHLRDHPEERDPEIAADCYRAMAAKMALELDSHEAAAIWIDKVNDYFEVSWEDIADVPEHERGPIYYKGRAAVSAICERQAKVETGWALKAIETGIQGAAPMRSYSKATLKKEAALGKKGEALG